MTQIPARPHATRPYVVRLVLARPRLFVSFVVGVLTAILLPMGIAQQAITKAIIGWNVGAGLYLVLAAKMMFWSSPKPQQKLTLLSIEKNVRQC